PYQSRSVSSQRNVSHRDLLSFPTRRSSDLPFQVLLARPRLECGLDVPFVDVERTGQPAADARERHAGLRVCGAVLEPEAGEVRRDRKSTRLNSSHVASSYAVFCLEKKNTVD